MKFIKSTLLLFLFATVFLFVTSKVFAAGVTAEVRIVGSSRTIFYNNVTIDGGCTVTDVDGGVHTYTDPLAICALDKASKDGGFSYKIKDSSFGIYLTGIAEDDGAADFSTYWLYDINGAGAQVGISSLTLNNNDKLFLHFYPDADPNARSSNDGIAYLRSQQAADGHINGFGGVSQWAAMAFAAKGIDISGVSKGGASLKSYLEANLPTACSSATDWEKDILAIVDTGANPYNFGGLNFVGTLKSSAYYNGTQIGDSSGLNDDFFGVMALIAAGVSNSDSVIKNSVSYIISKQNSDGGWGFSTSSKSDSNDTAAALHALSSAKNYGVTHASLDNAISQAKTYLLSLQASDGGFKYDGSSTDPDGSSTAWDLVGLNAAGMNDAATSAKKWLTNNQNKDGGFYYQASFGSDTYTTAHAVIGLSGKNWIIKNFDAGSNSSTGTTLSSCITPTPTSSVTPTQTPSPTNTPTPTPTSSTTNNNSTNNTTNTTNNYFDRPTPGLSSVVNRTLSENKVVDNPGETKEQVLGVQTDNSGSNLPKTVQVAGINNTPNVFAQLFFALGIAVLCFHIGSLYQKRKLA